MEEAGKLGTALVQQRKELAQRLKEVEKLQAEGDLTDELRTKLAEIEKEYNDVARETARAFLPKQRVPSNEAAGGSPYVPEGRGGRRSVSPSKFESQATGSPTKLSVPNRKIRNQPSNRVHDIEFAAEISTSLLAQVRNLQALLAEKDEELRDTKAEKSRLEIETEGFQQRVKTLDESEHRYKDENWNLETQIHELMASQKEGTDREKKMTQALNILQAEKNQAQKELDEVKLSHAKLAEEHEASIKHHDIELGTAKRSAALAETERTTLQRKIDDLMGQNQELAKAFSSQRGRGLERDHHMGMSDEDFETANDNVTPEHSPPPSPIKGTPRHSVLESETLKTSLLHAQRTIQSQRSQLHREKTEKLELKRLLQDSRDELERSRNDSGGLTNRRSRKVDSKEFKKPAKTLLGGLRSSRSEIVDDPEWEEHSEGVSPRRSSTHSTPTSRMPGPGAYPMTTDTSDQFDTANETSDAAFETANERGTETEGFHTGAEEFSDDDDAQTETESPSRSRRPPALTLAGNRNSFHSTASTSADEDMDYSDLRTPVAHSSQQKMRLKVSRGFLNRRSRQASEEPTFQSSPASFATSSANGTPQQAGQSLFAELAELEGSDAESLDATPSRRARSITPASVAKSSSTTPSVLALPQLAMVDSGIMTDPVKKSREPSPDLTRTRPVMVDCGVMTEPMEPLTPRSPASVVALDRPTSVSSTLDAGTNSGQSDTTASRLPDSPRSRPQSTWSYSDAGAQHDPGMDRELSQFPLPPTMQHGFALPSAPSLSFSAIDNQDIVPVPEPVVLPPAPAALTLTALDSTAIEPKAEPEPVPEPAPALRLSPILSETVEPKVEPEVAVPVPILKYSPLMSSTVEPRAEPEVILPAPVLGLSSHWSEAVEPRSEPAMVPPPPPPAPELAFSALVSEIVEPRPELEMAPPPPPPYAATHTLSPRFAFSTIDSVETRPLTPRTPKRDGFILPRGMESPFVNADQLRTPDDALFGGIAGRGQSGGDAGPVIAEDETRQSPSESRHPDTPESQKPFKEISSNVESRPARKPAVSMSDQSAQTSLTADAIDDMFNARSKSHNKSLSMGSSFGTPGTVRIRRYSQDQASLSSVRRMSVESQRDTTAAPQRPGSASSRRNSNVQPMPPLPQNHMEVIEAARSGSAHGTPGTASVMGPPLWPASAMRGQRPQTPSSVRPQSPVSVKGTPTPKAIRTGTAAHGTAIIHSPTKASARSRRSSVSSFASEIDTRFNIRANGLGVDATGFGPNTDPRMIQAITQTMIGEYLWKYTRKAGRGQMSENRHRRYFWVHPYTRTLYWSDRDPSTAGRADMKAKSVSIEAVRVVTDDNPMPPGLHRKSLIVVSPGRQIKFTCTTGSRHETWFNALSYLLLRTNDEGQTDAEEMAGHITQADVDEFNPQVGGMRPTASAAPSIRPRMAPSLSSYNSRTTRNQSPAIDMSMEVPRLTPTHQKNATPQRPSIGTLGRLSGYWKNSQVISGTFSSLRSRTASGQYGNSIYEASEVHDSAEDVREMIERQDREADRLENVRACCDGRHDVGTLHHHSTLKRSRGSHAHSQTGPSTTPSATPMSTTKSRT
ncbi:anucleate primary sterigmata protein A [Verticillium alfalfae VaMs.102]|uniref:Anucleate primary sterigmata protein A n=1 Tax=Verticillium alfalfae (strain VaMs.102 / ATCC MYA-4576 / FGSC 10136) TaxID=526221 RepID=C9SBY5_VERA1|nr:anucleate primary sterigmata protein A [Verticillium alfalfae VaMs.102]EEY15869.1 anucleate primary sterigmata protein A [Verticillium alfalfae VaMs.102]